MVTSFVKLTIIEQKLLQSRQATHCRATMDMNATSLCPDTNTRPVMWDVPPHGDECWLVEMCGDVKTG
jgi:hypothetical protein